MSHKISWSVWPPPILQLRGSYSNSCGFSWILRINCETRREVREEKKRFGQLLSRIEWGDWNKKSKHAVVWIFTISIGKRYEIKCSGWRGPGRRCLHAFMPRLRQSTLSWRAAVEGTKATQPSQMQWLIGRVYPYPSGEVGPGQESICRATDHLRRSKMAWPSLGNSAGDQLACWWFQSEIWGWDGRLGSKQTGWVLKRWEGTKFSWGPASRGAVQGGGCVCAYVIVVRSWIAAKKKTSDSTVVACIMGSNYSKTLPQKKYHVFLCQRAGLTSGLDVWCWSCEKQLDVGSGVRERDGRGPPCM